MDKDIVTLIGYHGTSSNCIDSISFNGLDPEMVSKRDDHWLGQGIYFYEDLEQAIWWAGKEADRQGGYPIVYKSTIEVPREHFLDLDKYYKVDDFYTEILNLYKRFDKADFDNKPIFDNPGEFRAVFFDYYKRIKAYYVIQYTFSKDCTTYGQMRSRQELKIQKDLVEYLMVAYKETQICVSEKECIRDIEIVYNGEYEVI